MCHITDSFEEFKKARAQVLRNCCKEGYCGICPYVFMEVVENVEQNESKIYEPDIEGLSYYCDYFFETLEGINLQSCKRLDVCKKTFKFTHF